MDENDVKNIIFSIRDQKQKLKKTVQENLKVPRSYTDKPISSKFSIPYDPSLDDIRDTLEIDESFDTIETGSRRYPPLQLVPNITKPRPESENAGNYGRFRPNDFVSSRDQIHYDEYSFHTPQAINDRDVVFIKTAEFEGLVDDDADPYYHPNYPKSSKQRPRKSPQEISQRDSIRENEDFKNMKQLAEALLYDNKSLHQDIEDFKKAMQLLVEKHKEVQKELENERKKSSKIAILEQQLMQERAKTKYLNEQNYMLRDKCVKFIEFLQQLGSDEQKFTEQEEKMYAQIEEENRQLRELLGISRVSDPKFEDIDQYLKQKLNQETEDSKEDTNVRTQVETNGDLRLTPNLIADFRKERERMFSARRTLSIYSEKSDKATPRIGGSMYISTENALDAAVSGTPNSSRSWEPSQFLKTNESTDSNKHTDLSLEKSPKF